MWSMNTNKYLGGALVVAWLLLIVDFVGDQLVPPVEPVVATASASVAPLTALLRQTLGKRDALDIIARIAFNKPICDV